MPLRRPRVLLAMAPELLPRLFDDATAHRLRAVAELDPELVADDFGRPEVGAALAEAEILFTFWGAPAVDADVLAAAPRLKAVVHAAGSVKHFVTDACWERGIIVSSAAQANSLPVAEYTVAMVLLSNKRVLQLRDEYRSVRGLQHAWHLRYGHAGNYRRTVGIVGASRIGRRVIELLRPYDLEPVLYDPYVSEEQARALGVRGVGLDELCRISDVVSLHAPALPETRSMIDRRRLALMRDGATLINTARGSLVDPAALTRELATGRIQAVIDVTEPEVLPADSPLYDLPNVLLTPHIAGSLGNELHRMADSAVEEIIRYAAGLPFLHEVHREELDRTA
ncbi:hydroxyacid dehydrogenase [Streptomyces sp. NPDC059874]|uniref:hydroxyacid dehydrogenase n=1 Tax=Streptomyces sp. NPDC059874 TaxID=3346983 RepID=UPI003657E889